TARFRMRGRVLHHSLDKRSRRTLAERTAREVVWQLKIEVKCAVAIGLAFGEACVEYRNICAGSLNRDLCVIHGLAEKVVRAYDAGDVFAGTIVLLFFAVAFRKFDSDFELRQHIALD